MKTVLYARDNLIHNNSIYKNSINPEYFFINRIIMNNLDRINLDSNSYNMTELENLLGLSSPYTLELLHLKRDTLRDKIAKMPNMEINKKNNILVFFDNIVERLLVNISKNDLKDISALHAMKLTNLNLSNTKVRDLAILTGMPLKTLNVSSTSVKSIDPLNGMPLTSLNFAATRVRDLDALESLKQLKNLTLSESLFSKNKTFLKKLSKVKITQVK